MSIASAEGPKFNMAPLDFSSCSLESILSVPTRFIFLETRTGPRVSIGNAMKPKNYLFSRSEMSTLLQVSMLSFELDVILSVVYESLDRTHKCKSYREFIQTNKGTVYLRALLPLLDIHAQTAENALNHITCEALGLNHVLNTLAECAVELEKFAEQNWNMADQLEWSMMPGQSSVLSREKRAIAEIEDAVVERIHNLNSMSCSPSLVTKGGIVNANNCMNDENQFSPMDKICAAAVSKIAESESIKEEVHSNDQIHTELATTGQRVEEDGTSQISISVQNAVEALRTLGSNSRDL